MGSGAETERGGAGCLSGCACQGPQQSQELLEEVRGLRGAVEVMSQSLDRRLAQLVYVMQHLRNDACHEAEWRREERTRALQQGSGRPHTSWAGAWAEDSGTRQDEGNERVGDSQTMREGSEDGEDGNDGEAGEGA
jgi:hypothetical protein